LKLKNKIIRAPKYWLIISSILNIFGLIALYSISQDEVVLSFSSRFTKFLFWFFPAISVFILFFYVPIKIIHDYSYIALFTIFVLLFIPYFFDPIAGTHRWISLGYLRFQPAEIMKWVAVLGLSRYLSDQKLKLKKITTIIYPIIFTLIPFFVIAKQPDLGSAIIVIAPLIPLLFWVGVDTFHIIFILAPILSILTAFHIFSFTIWIGLFAIILYLYKKSLIVNLNVFFGNIFLGLLSPLIWNSLTSYQQGRILVFLDVSKDPLGAAYQVIQSQTAIGSGGFWGKGFGNGSQTHLKFLPEQETDFIFSVIGEEFGFLVVSIILILFSILILDMVQKSFKLSERFPSLVLFGIAVIFMCHVFVNIGMTVNLLPVKGLPLPFLSYGGTFLVSCYAMLGLAMNMAVEEK
tara:strand:+ start:65875 stop:67092 length:1218 start_codon:yes stop_codon:yes gene_type:complete